MRQDKLNKYMTGDFELKQKEIIAYKELNKIKQFLIKKIVKQRGGASEGKKVEVIANSQIEHFNETRQELNSGIDSTLDKFVDDNETSKIIENIKKAASEKNVQINDGVFEELMTADKQLLNSFKEFNDIFQASGIIDDKSGLSGELLKIQQGLFKLQVKIIFSKLKQIKIECEKNGVETINITKLFTSIRQKVDAMNNFMEAQANTTDTNQVPADGITAGEESRSVPAPQQNNNASQQSNTASQQNNNAQQQNNEELQDSNIDLKQSATTPSKQEQPTLSSEQEQPKPASNPTSDTASKPSVDPASKPASKLSVDPALKPASKLSVDPASKPASKLSVDPALKPASKLSVDPASKPASKSSVDPASTQVKSPSSRQLTKKGQTPTVNPSEKIDKIKSSITKEDVKTTEKTINEVSKSNDKTAADNIKELENENKLRLQLEEIEKKKRQSEEKINELYRKQSTSESQVAVNELNKLKTKQLEAEKSEVIIPRNNDNKNITIQNNNSTGLATLDKADINKLQLNNNSITNTSNILTLLNNNSIDKRLNNLIQQGGNNSSESLEIYTRLFD